MDSKLFDPQLIIEIFRRNLTEHYFDMNGRVSRAEFWLFVLACVIVTLVASIIGGIVGFGGLLGTAVNLVLLLPLAGLGARRLQDTGKAGGMVWFFILPTGINLLLNAWFYLTVSPLFGWYGYYDWYFWPVRLLSLIGLIAGIYIAYLCAQPGTTGQNAFGPEPAKPVPPSPKAAT